MTNKVDFSEWNPDWIETDGEDLIRTIYAYYCSAGYPKSLQDAREMKPIIKVGSSFIKNLPENKANLSQISIDIAVFETFIS